VRAPHIFTEQGLVGFISCTADSCKQRCPIAIRIFTFNPNLVLKIIISRCPSMVRCFRTTSVDQTTQRGDSATGVIMSTYSVEPAVTQAVYDSKPFWPKTLLSAMVALGQRTCRHCSALDWVLICAKYKSDKPVLLALRAPGVMIIKLIIGQNHLKKQKQPESLSNTITPYTRLPLFQVWSLRFW